MANRFLNNININDSYTLPSSDGSADQIIQTDGSGNLTFVDPSVLSVGESEQVHIACKNTSGVAISKGDPVYITGTVGTSFRVEIAAADASNSAKMPAVGLAESDLGINDEGFVIVSGVLKNLTTDPLSTGDGTPSSNDTVYVKAGGGLTRTKPTGSGNLIQNVGKVGRVNSSNAGSLAVSTIMRTNDVPNLTTGKIWVGSSTYTTESGVIHLDETNNRLGIGTDNPVKPLHIYSSNDAPLRVESSDATTGILFADSTSNNALYYVGSGDYFYTTAKLGIGTTSPSAKLDVAGNVSISNTATARLDISGGGNGYVNAAVSLRTTDDNTNRGNGIYSYNDARGIEWFFGNPYNTSDSFSINRRTGATGYSESTADPSYSIFTVSSNGDLNINGRLLAGDTSLTSSHMFYSADDKTIRLRGNDNWSGIGFLGNTGTEGFLYHNSAGEFFQMTHLNSMLKGSYIPDNEKAYFGDGTDLEIYHSGTNSYIRDIGTGELMLLANAFSLRNSSDTELMITAIENGAVNLYHNNSLKLNTTATGVDITGNLDVSGTVTFGDDITIPNNTSIIAPNSTGSETSQLIGTTGSNGIVIGQSARWNSTNIYSGGVGYTLEMDSSKNSTFNGNLDVTGTGSFTGALQVSSVQGINSTGWVHLHRYANSLNVAVGNNGTNVNLIVPNGSVGVGTGSPSAKLHLYTGGLGTNTGVTDMLRIELNRSDHSTTPSGPAILFKDQDSNNNTNEARIKMMTVNDTDYGDNDEAASNLLFETTNNGVASDKMIITGRGNVGIGTTNPSQKLEVNGAVLSGDYRGSNNIYLTSPDSWIFRSTGGSERMRVTSSGNVGIGTTIPVGKFNSFISSTRQLTHNGNGGDLSIISDNNSTPVFYVKGTGTADLVNIFDNTTEVFTILDGGNVGIGTASPSAQLEIRNNEAGDGVGGATLRLTRGDSTSVAGDPVGTIEFYSTDADTAKVTAYIKSMSEELYGREGSLAFGVSQAINTDATEAMRITNEGNVGIGTTSPGTPLHVYKAGTSNTQTIVATLGSNSTRPVLSFAENASSGITTGMSLEYNGSGTGDTNYMVINSVANVPRFTVMSGGNVGIGTTSPSSLLHLESASSPTLQIKDTTNNVTFKAYAQDSNSHLANTSNHDLFIDTNNISRITVKAGGNVGIGTTNPAYKLDVNGGAGVALRLNSTADSQLMLNSSNSWTGIGFNDGAASGTDYIWHNGVNQTFAIGGGGSNVSGKKLHVHGATTIGSGLAGTAAPTDGLLVEGNVGIGTTSPDSLLELENSPAAQTQSRMLHIDNNPSSNQGSGYIEISSGTNSQAKTQIEQVSSGGYGLLGNQYIDTNIINRGLSSSPYGNINFATGSSTSATSIVMTIGGGSQKGNVGIGTTSPGHLLEIRGTSDALSVGDDSNTQTYMRFANSRTMVGYSGADAVIQGGSGKGIRLNVNNDSFNSGTVMYINSSGNVGIGTTNPQGTMHITRSTGDAVLRIEADTNNNDENANPRIELKQDGAIIYSHFGLNGDADNTLAGFLSNSAYWLAAGNIHIAPGNTLSTTFASSGNVGIGTTTPSQKLDVSGNIKMTETAATTDTDKFIVSDSGVLKYRTGSQVLSDIGAASSSHNHDSDYVNVTGDTMTGNLIIANNNSIPLSITGANSNYTSAAILNTGTGDAKIWFDASNGDLLGNDYASIGQHNDLNLVLNVGTNGGDIVFQESGGETMRIHDGNVGIGTTNPLNPLSIESSSSPLIKIRNTTNGGGAAIEFNDNSASAANQNGRIKYVHSDGASQGGGSSFILEGQEDQTLQVLNNGRIVVQKTGSSAEVGYGFYDDVNTGMYSPGADTVALATGGTTRLYIDSSGDVGIGTNNPGEKLHVNGNAKIDYSLLGRGIRAANRGELHLNATGINDVSEIFFGYGNGYTESNIRWGLSDRGVNEGSFHVYRGPANGSFTRVQSWYDNLDSSFYGNVGIGETSVDAKLHLTAASSGLINQKFESAGSAAWRLGIPASQTYFAFDNANDNLSAPKVVIDSDGNVGIGTTNPNYKLSVDDNTVTTTPKTLLQFDAASIADNGGYNIDFRTSSNDTADRFVARIRGIRESTGALSQLSFWTESGSALEQRMTIRASGNIGIGTDSPSAKLDVNGNIKLTETAATVDTDKFAVLDSGVLKYRTGANVLSDIGAAASSHNHDDRYFRTQTGQVSNLDTAFGRGNTYYWANTATNSPVPSSYGTLMTLVNANGNYNGTNNWLTQLGWTTGGVMSWRQKINSGAFSAWKTIAEVQKNNYFTSEQHITVNENNYLLNLRNGSETNFMLRAYNDGTTTTNGRSFNLGLYYGTIENASIQFNRGGGSTGGFLVFTTNNGYERARINSSGNFSIGNTNDTYKLDVSGTGRFTGDVYGNNFIISSDYRLKTNIETLKPKPINVNWRTFNMKSEDTESGKRYGVIAQELEEYHPEFVNTDDEGFKSVKYIDLLIAKIAELEQEIKNLKNGKST